VTLHIADLFDLHVGISTQSDFPHVSGERNKEEKKKYQEKKKKKLVFGHRESNSGSTGLRWKRQTLENANAENQGQSC